MADLPSSTGTSAFTTGSESYRPLPSQTSGSLRISHSLGSNTPRAGPYLDSHNLDSHQYENLGLTLDSMHTWMEQMHANFQQQLQAQQSDFEVQIRQLSTNLESDRELLSRLASPSTPVFASSSHLSGPKNTMHTDDEGASQSQSHLDIHHLKKPASNKSYPGQPSPSPKYAPRNPYHSSATVPPVRIKASELPKFNGSRDEDVQIWLRQVSAIFDANKCADTEIVAYLSVTLKETALQWFTRLGRKGRSKFINWIDWQDGLRQRFLKPNYLADKERQWKQRELRIDEDISDYFDEKVDLQAFIFDQGTPDSELILDIIDGLPEYMLPTLKRSIKPGMSRARGHSYFVG
jgi:hypothetical protein